MMYDENPYTHRLSGLITSIYSLKLIPSMEISVKINVNLDKINMDLINLAGLENSSMQLIKIARENAPIDTSTLKKSIGKNKPVSRGDSEVTI